MRASRQTRILSAVIAAGAVVASLSGCGVIGDITDAVQGKSDAFDLKVGDCFNNDTVLGSGEEIESVEMPACSEPHDYEAYHSYDLSADFEADGVLDTDGIFADADAVCLEAFEDFAGISVLDTSLDFSYLYPTDASWAEGDREILCMAFDPAGKVSDSLADKGGEYPLES